MTEPWTTLKLIQWTASYFEKKDIPNPRLDAELLLAYVLDCKRIELYTGYEKTVPEKHLSAFKALIERRAKREPLQYILGETEFWGLKIKVTPDVLIPRPETELLVEEALKILNREWREVSFRSQRGLPDQADGGLGASDPEEGPLRGARSLGRRAGSPPVIMDIGTGSGCIAVALAKHLPDAAIVATDISQEALALARENAGSNEVGDRIEFIPADIAPWKRFLVEERVFDVIVSNPPYIPSVEMPGLQAEVRDFEPKRALDGGPDGLEAIRRILEESPPFLKPDGRLLLEVGEGQAGEIKRTVEAGSPFSCDGVKKDYAGIERILLLRKPS